MTETRHLTLTATELEDLDACLAWIVQKHEREFAQADFVNISIGQVYEVGAEPDTGQYRWTSSISGHLKPSK